MRPLTTLAVRFWRLPLACLRRVSIRPPWVYLVGAIGIALIACVFFAVGFGLGRNESQLELPIVVSSFKIDVAADMQSQEPVKFPPLRPAVRKTRHVGKAFTQREPNTNGEGKSDGLGGGRSGGAGGRDAKGKEPPPTVTTVTTSSPGEPSVVTVGGTSK